ncbi:hypothetical protein VTG60DRAFT_7360 [Thermothelomyces hinnuleus]
MQGHVTGDELAQSITAFAVPGVCGLIHIIYTLAFGKRSSLLRPRLDWEIQLMILSWFLLGVAGISLALLTARTGDVRFHLGLKGVGLLSVEVLVIVIAGRPVFQIYLEVRRVYRDRQRPLPSLWLDFLIVFEAVSHPLLLGSGLWKLIDDGVEFIWVAPSTHHLVLFLLQLSLYITWGCHRGWKHLGWWGVGFLTANLVAFVLPVVGVSLRSRRVHLSQSLSSFVVILFADVRRWWRAEHPAGDESPLRNICSGVVGVKMRDLSGGTRENGTDLEGSIEWASWKGEAGVRQPPRVHMQEQGVGTAS